jgi:hypothetical protein
MKRLIEFPLQDGSSMIVEVDEPETFGGVTRTARPSDVIEKAHQTLDDALDKITPAAQTVISKLRGLHDEPDEIEVEFGIKLSAAAGAFVASAGVEANYKVTLKWAKK